jgi:hypothetical protein
VEEIESDNEDTESKNKTSLGELWAIDAKTKIKIKSREDLHSNQKLHPTTIMSFP